MGDVFRGAIRSMAKGVLLVHNHPSGSPAPSAQDKDLTRRAAKAGQVLGYPLFDHVIIAKTGSFSLCSNRDERRKRLPAIPLRQAAERTNKHWT
jgi:DNA repair protein RadC